MSDIESLVIRARELIADETLLPQTRENLRFALMYLVTARQVQEQVAETKKDN